MPYSAQHKLESRRRILASAYKLFSAKGYDNVSIDEVMANANMTRGGFYAHFQNKSKLYQEALLYAAEISEINRCKPDDMDDEKWIRNLLQEYLHKNNLTSDCRCPLASLATDVSVREPEVRKAYTRTFKGMNSIIAKYTKTFSSSSEETIMAATALIVGGLAIARALADAELAEQLLENCRTEALRLLDAQVGQ